MLLNDSTNAIKKQEENLFIASLHTPSVPPPKLPRCHPHLLTKIPGKSRAVAEAAGECNFRNGVVGGTEHFDGDSEAMSHQILFGREVLMLHEDPIEVSALDAGVAGGVGNADRVGIIIFQVFFCFCEILGRGIGTGFQGRFLHKRKKKQKMTGGGKQIGWIRRKGL